MGNVSAQTGLVESVPEGQLGGPKMRLVMEEKRRERKEKKEPDDRNINKKTD